MLRRSQGDEDVSISDIVASTSAVLFLGTPHRGSSYAPMGETLRRIVSAFGFDTNDRNIRALHFDSIELELSREEFLKIWRARAFEVRTFQEAQGLAGVKGFSGKVRCIMISFCGSSRPCEWFRLSQISPQLLMIPEKERNISKVITWACVDFRTKKILATAKYVAKYKE